MVEGAGEEPSSVRDGALLDALRRATLGEYEIREELGRGGMAVVYLAHEIRLGRKVALKVLAPHLQAIPGMAERFLREAQTAARLEHPNIIPIFALKEAQDFVFFTMRYVAGAALSRLRKQVGKFPVPLVRALVADVGAALSHAHSEGVLHRDVKPANVMVGQDGAVFVTDFGIAKQPDGPGLTLTGQLLGTPGYMSPEQTRGRTVSPASDQYSLGTMAFELLAGRPPFVGSNAMDVMAQQMTQDAPDLLGFRPDCPGELAAAVARMLALEPQHRFASIDDALAAARAATVFPGDPIRVQLRKLVESPSNVRVFAVTPVSATPNVAVVMAPAAPPAAKPAAPPAKPPAEKPAAPPAKPQVVPVAVPSPSASAATIPGPPPVRPRPRRGYRNLLLPAGGVVAAAVLVTVWLTTGDGGTGIQPDTQPVTLVGPVTPGDSGARATDTVEVAAPTPSDTSTVSPPTPQPPPPSTGTLVIDRLPAGGRIRIDGRRAAGRRVELDAGRHAVTLEAPGFVTADTSVVVTAGETATLAVALQRVPPEPPAPVRPVLPRGEGVLMLRVRPFARVFVNGRLAVEDEQLVRSLPEGEHRLRFEKAGFDTKDTTVVIQAGDTLKRSFTLQRKAP